MDTFLGSSFGFLVMTLFQGILTTPSWQTFTYLACGWALARDRHTITTGLWLTGATTAKHFSRFYVFRGCPLDDRRWQLWAAVIRLASRFVPESEGIRMAFDDTTKKKAGTHIEGLYRHRNAGLSKARISHASGLELRPGHYAYSPQMLARPPPQRASWPRTLSQTCTSPKTQRAVSFSKSVGP